MQSLCLQPTSGPSSGRLRPRSGTLQAAQLRSYCNPSLETLKQQARKSVAF
jgi:hypothetical protein